MALCVISPTGPPSAREGTDRPISRHLQCSVIFGWDLHDTVYPRELLISNKENGYHDLHAEVDLASFRRLPYENDCPLFLITYLDPDTKVAIPPCPRGMLRRVLDRIGDGVEGFKGLAGVEFEYFQVRPVERPSLTASSCWALTLCCHVGTYSSRRRLILSRRRRAST